MTRRLFTLAEARSLLPAVSRLVDKAVVGAAALRKLAGRADVAGRRPEGYVPIVYVKFLVEMAEANQELANMGVLLKDIGKGLVDFPCRHDGRIILLCWERGENEIGFWHSLESGYAGRRPVEELQQGD